jgi:acetyltransferase-like isoleucine patch superfamily enzyme
MRKLFWILRYMSIYLMTWFYSLIARIRLYYSGAVVGEGIVVNGWLILAIHPSSSVEIGKSVRLNSGYARNPVGGSQRLSLSTSSGAVLKIGERAAISNTSIVCWNEILIEKDVFIGGGCGIYDTDFHPINSIERLNLSYNDINTARIIIKKESFIGAHCIILKGVSIGEGAVIGAGSVVSRNIPDYEIWAGNPIHRIGIISKKISAEIV